MENNPRAKTAIDCEEMAHGTGGRAITVGNAFRGKARKHGGSVLMLSHGQGVESSLKPLSCMLRPAAD